MFLDKIRLYILCFKNFLQYYLVLIFYTHRSQCEKNNGNTTLICNHNECLIDPSLLDMIKIQSRQFGWSAKNYSAFWGRTYDEGLKWRLGTLQSPEKVLSGT